MNNKPYVKLPLSFYLRADVVKIARELLGKYLFTRFDGKLTAGKIVETEAYCGRNDRACHAYLRRTERTEVMYQRGGKAYIYLCYGIHHLFNIVTNREGLADAVLVRAIEPVIGVEEMKIRRDRDTAHRLTSGPGTLSQALAIHRDFTGTDLRGEQIWIAGKADDERVEIRSDVRIGVDFAGEDALLPWRFYVKDNGWVSKIKKYPDEDRGTQNHS